MPVYETPLAPGQAVRYWQFSPMREERYDLAPRTMQGRMDALFFVASQRNFIPHEYPCRTEFAKLHRDKRPVPKTAFEPGRWWFPFGSDRVDLSGFWFRPTLVECWARTVLHAERAGEARFRLTTPGGVLLRCGGQERGWVTGYRRNLERSEEVAVPLEAGPNEVEVWFGDLCERDTRYAFTLTFLSGPPVTVSLPVPIEPALAASIEGLLEGMHFERPSYQGGEVALRLPQAAPVALDVRITVTDEAPAGEPVVIERALEEGARRLVVGEAAELPAEFRQYRVHLSAGSFAVERTLGVEVCPSERMSVAPPDLASRAEEALQHAATAAQHDTVRALARLALGLAGPETDAAIARCLPAIEDCHDCADFLLVPLLWCRAAWPGAIGPDLLPRVDETILGFRYWISEPGDDVMWWFSENHALLFHTACHLAGALFPDRTFARSGRTGREQEAIGRARLNGWFDHFDRAEMSEWNSAPYFPIDLKGLCALQALSPDADIRERAARAVRRLLEIVARSSHQGSLTASQGRAYEHSLRPARTLELSAIARLLWGKGWLGGRFHALPQLALCLRDHGLEVDPALRTAALWDGEGALEWCFRQGDNGVAALYQHKARHHAMGSVAGYRAGEWGYQEAVLHLRLGDRPQAQMWINHPGEAIQYGFGRPSYWGGCGTLPRVHQYRALALLDFQTHADLPDFTHVWLPEQEFDEVLHDGPRVLVRAGAALALVQGSAPLERIGAGPTAGCEYRLNGRRGRWLVRLSELDREGSLEAFGRRFAALQASDAAAGRITVEDPGYGRVICSPDAVVEAEGRRLDPKTWTLKGETALL